MNIGFSLIGTPDGFDSLDAGLSKGTNIGFKVDLDNKSINIFPKSEILFVIREKKDNDIFFHFTLYRHAKGMGSNRTGTFYGSTIILKNVKSDASLIWQSLVDMADLVKTNCLTKNDKFNKNISSISSNLPDSLNNLQNSLTNIGYYYFKPSNNKIFFRIGRDFKNYSEFISTVFEDEMLYDFDLIYISNSAEVEADVQKKGLVSIVSIGDIAKQRKTNIDILIEKNKILTQNLSDTNKIISKQGIDISDKSATINRLQTDLFNLNSQFSAYRHEKSIKPDSNKIHGWKWERLILVYVASILFAIIFSSLLTYIISNSDIEDRQADSIPKSTQNTPSVSETKKQENSFRNKHCKDFLELGNWNRNGKPVSEEIKNVSQLIESYKKSGYELEGCEKELINLISTQNKNDVAQEGEEKGMFKKRKFVVQPDLDIIR